jgi:hypothetical protein
VKRLFAAAALSLSACLFEGGDAPAPVVPLAVGNAWTYAESTFQDGLLTETWSSETSITGKRVLEGGPTVFVQNTRNRFTLDPGTYSAYVNNVGASHYTYGAEEHGVSVRHETLHVKWPAKRGERYFTQFVGVDTLNAEPVLDTLEIEVVTPDTTCATLAGTFACVHYRGYRGGSVYADTWYAPGVGYLGSEIRRFAQRNGALQESRHVKKLASYTLY